MSKISELGVGRKMSEFCKVRGLPEKCPKDGENENSVGSSPKPGKTNTGLVFMKKWVKLVNLVSDEKWVNFVRSGAYPKMAEKWLKNAKIKRASDLPQNLVK